AHSASRRCAGSTSATPTRARPCRSAWRPRSTPTPAAWPSPRPRCSSDRLEVGQLVELAGDVGSGRFLPGGLSVLGAEQAGQPEQLTQHRGATGGEGAVVDVPVLRADTVDVGRVAAVVAGEDGQVGVAEDLAVAVAGV